MAVGAGTAAAGKRERGAGLGAGQAPAEEGEARSPRPGRPGPVPAPAQRSAAPELSPARRRREELASRGAARRQAVQLVTARSVPHSYPSLPLTFLQTPSRRLKKETKGRRGKVRGEGDGEIR